MFHYYIIFISFISPSNYGVGVLPASSLNYNMPMSDIDTLVNGYLNYNYSTYKIDSVRYYEFEIERNTEYLYLKQNYSKAHPLLTQN